MGTSMVVSSAPSLGVGGLVSLTLKAGGAAFGLRTAAQVAQAAQTWGLRGTAATAGLQTFGGMYGDAVQGYMSRGDSESTALNKAFIPALAGAASTYLLTAAGGTQGIEALLRQPAFKENFRQWFKAVAAGSVKEGLREEAPDQLIQGIIERYTYNPDKPWKDIIEETLQAGIGGALLGGAAEATTTGLAPAKTSQDQPQPPIPSNTTPVTPDGSVQPSPATTDGGQQTQTPPAAADLKEVGQVLDNIQRLKDKAKGGALSLDEQRELDHHEKVLAQTRVKNLEKEQQVIRSLPQPRELDPVKAKALEEARAVLKRPVPGEPSAPPPEASIPDTTTNKPDDTRPSSAPPPGMEPSPQSSSGGSRLQFSQGGTNPKPTTDSDIVDAHRSLSQEEDAFQLGKSKPDTSKMSMPDALAELAKSFSQEGKELRVRRGGGENSTHYMVDTPHGTAYFDVDPSEKTLSVNSAILESDSTKSGGGSNVYQLAATFAHQHGLKFVADYTVSPKAQNRRISHMVSSMLRHGTSDHFDGNVPFVDSESSQIKTELPGWKPGAHDHNLALALSKEHDIVMAAAKAKGIDLSHLTYDAETHTIINGHTGTPLTQGTLQSLVDRFEPGDSGVGKTTLLRALVTGSTLQGSTSGGRVPALHVHPGGNPGGAETGESYERLVRLARHLYYSRPSGSAGGVPTRRMGDALSERPNGLASAVAQVSDHLKTQVPGLLHDNTHVFHSVEELLNSDYAKQHPFSKEDLAGLQNAEGFHDPKTGHSVVIAGNVELRPGETPQDALTRVILHERVGHDGLQTLLGSKDSKAQQHWEGLTQRIPQAELDAIASQQGYQHLKDNPTALAHEWFARQAEKTPHLLKKPGLLRDMWEAFKAQLRKMSNNWKDTDESHLDTHLQELLRHSRKAALRKPSASQSVSART